LFDTQLIIEKAKQGSEDYAMHALELFTDLVAVFVRLVVILARNSEKKKQEKAQNRR
jgi:FtsH-binding integral membrane protein